MRPFRRLGAAAVFSALALASCTDRSAVGPETNPGTAIPGTADSPLPVLDCAVSVRDGRMACGAAASTAAGGPNADVVVGGQDVNVRLSSSNVAYDGDTETL